MRPDQMLLRIHEYCRGKKLGEIHIAAAVLVATEQDSFEAGKKVIDYVIDRLPKLHAERRSRI